MEKERMLVTQGLNELKLLDSRIEKSTKEIAFISCAKTVEDKIKPGLTKIEFNNKAKSGYQSLTDMIARRSKIKSAIILSNASTKVIIADKEMTVAEAIDLKATIDYKVKLLNAMRSQYNSAVARADALNDDLEERIDNYLMTAFGKDYKGKKEDYAESVEPIRKAGQYSLVDPLNLLEKINQLEEEITSFRSNVDGVLQISNCSTWIEF